MKKNGPCVRHQKNDNQASIRPCPEQVDTNMFWKKSKDAKEKGAPPPYDSKSVPKAVQWKKALQNHQYSDIEFVVDLIIDQIDKSVNVGIFPTYVALYDAEKSKMTSSEWTEHKERLSEKKVVSMNCHKAVYLRDHEESRPFFTNYQLSNCSYRERFKEIFEEKTGLIFESSKCYKGLRTSDDKSEFTVGYVDLYYRMP